MIVKAQLKTYEKIEFSITMTAPVEDWRVALKQLEKLKDNGWVAWPLSGFSDAIIKMLTDLDKTHVGVLTKENQAVPVSAEHSNGP